MSGLVFDQQISKHFWEHTFFEGACLQYMCHLWRSRSSHAEFKPIFACVPDSICHHSWKIHVRTRFPNPQTSKQRQSPCCATWRSTLLFWGHRGVIGKNHEEGSTWREFQSLNDINCIKPNVCHIRICDLLITFSGWGDLRIVKLRVWFGQDDDLLEKWGSDMAH